MKVFFSLPEFDGQLLRALTYTPMGGADLGECLTTAARIKEGDFDSWHQEWMDTADRIYAEAEDSLQKGHLLSASQSYLRASNYYRTAYYFLGATPIDPRVVEAYDKQTTAFEKAMEIIPWQVENVQIPYQDSYLPGYYFSQPGDQAPRQTIITFTGYDGTRQETYFSVVKSALDRGFNVLCFDGPGQGEMLIKRQVPMTADWETAVAAAVDYLLNRPDVKDDAISLIGESWGGMLAPLAACKEHRLAAMVVCPGQYDALQTMKKAIPQIETLLSENNYAVLDQMLASILADKMLAAKFRFKMWVHGVDTALELLKVWTQFTLEGKAQAIQCPTLVIDCENERFSAGQAKQLYDALQCPKQYILCKNADGAGEHCCGGALTYLNQKIFDWLQETLNHPLCTHG